MLQVPFNTFGPRLASALDRVPIGSFMLVLAPVLDDAPLLTSSADVTKEVTAEDGTVSVTTSSVTKAVVYPTASDVNASGSGSAASIHDVMDIEGDGSVAVPKPRIPASALTSVPPALRVHYIPEDTSSNSSNSSSESQYVYRPALRAWSGPDPLSRVVVSMWKGKSR